VLQWLLDQTPIEDCLVDWTLAHVNAGYGLHFLEWALKPDRAPYGSLGNGGAMRVSPVGWLGGQGLADVARLAAETAAPTHGHHHGTRGAKAVAVAVRMALEGWSKEEVAAVLADRFGYDLSRRTGDIRPRYCFEVAAHRSVPEALICALEADSWEGAVRLAVSLGGDADTQACIAGAVAEALYGLPGEAAAAGEARLPPEMRDMLARFRAEAAGRAWPRTDPGRIDRDRAPERDGPDPFSTEHMMAQMAKLERLAAAATAPRAPSLWGRLRRLARRAAAGGRR